MCIEGVPPGAGTKNGENLKEKVSGQRWIKKKGGWLAVGNGKYRRHSNQKKGEEKRDQGELPRSRGHFMDGEIRSRQIRGRTWGMGGGRIRQQQRKDSGELTRGLG